MIRRNVAGQVIYFPQLTTTDGTPITSSATLTVAKDGAEAAAAGTLNHSGNGVWKYAPTQGETDTAIVGLILTYGTVSIVLNLVTTAANTAAVAFEANTTTPPTANAIAQQTRTALTSELAKINTLAFQGNRVQAVSTLEADQAVNVTKVGGTAVSSPDDLKANVSGLALQTSVDNLGNRLPTTLDGGLIRAKVVSESAGLAKEGTVNAVGQAVISVNDSVTTLLNRIPQDIFTGITRLARWLGVLAGKAADSATLTEIQATTAGASFNNTTDSLEAIRDRGDNAWVGGAGNGEYVMTITVSDGTNAVPNCRVSIVGTGLFGFTNTSGVASFNVSGSATYSVRVTPPVTFDTPSDTSIVVAAQNVSQTIVVTAKPAVNPSAAPQCNVVLPVTDGAGSALTGAKVSIQFVRFEAGATPSSVVIPPVPELTSAAGVVTIPLLRFGRYRATYSYQSGVKDFEFIVPDAGSATIVEPV